MTSWAGSAASEVCGGESSVSRSIRRGPAAKYLLSREKVMKKGQKGEEVREQRLLLYKINIMMYILLMSKWKPREVTLHVWYHYQGNRGSECEFGGLDSKPSVDSVRMPLEQLPTAISGYKPHGQGFLSWDSYWHSGNVNCLDPLKHKVMVLCVCVCTCVYEIHL